MAGHSPFYLRQILLVMVLLMTACLPAMVEAAKVIPVVPRLAAPEAPVTFDSPQWKEAGRYEGFDVPPNSSDARGVLENTTVQIFHDGEKLYILYTAWDKKISELNAEPLDEFADACPQGDHGELYIAYGYVFAFGPQGNRYDALDFDRSYDSGFQVKSRVMTTAVNGGTTAWQSLLIIPMQGIVRHLDKPLNLTFVRHLDHGLAEPQRTTLAMSHLKLQTK